MAISTDNLLDRIRLKGQVRKWRTIAIVIAAFALISLLPTAGGIPGRDFIARISVVGIIEDDIYRTDILREIEENKNVKAVIVYVDSPGGTAVGGEELYESLRNIAKVKPVVAIMGNMATSAGYLIIADADRIFARQASITGSIGVLIQTPNIQGLTDKIGVKMDTIKTGPLKDSPSIFENMSPEARAVMQGVVDSFYQVFVKIVADGRNLPIEDVKKLADGRIYTGLQAIENKLVDEIGGEDAAIDWLIKNRKIKSTLEIREVPLYRPENKLEKFLNSAISGKILIPKAFSLQGLLSIWQNGVID